MMYIQKMVLAVKSSGKILREVKDTVMIPFGSEYSLLIKNLNSVRAMVRVSIDGTDVTEGVSLVVAANSELELERFVKGANTKQGNRFKFIERSAAVEAHRGIKADDGLIRIEFQFEKVLPKLDALYNRGVCTSPPLAQPWDNWIKYGPVGTATPQDQLYGPVNVGASTQSTYASTSASKGILRSYVPQNDAGITVPGSVSDQSFETVRGFSVESEKHVMVLRMIGETDEGVQIQTPVTVKAKPKCVTCGRHNKATAKFCSECGTSLELVGTLATVR